MPPLSEFQKTIFTITLGFLFGLLGEPLKIRLTDRLKRKRLRRVCYEEILDIRSALAHALALYREDPGRKTIGGKTASEYLVIMVSGIGTSRLRYAIEKEPGLIFQTDLGMIAQQIVNALDVPIDKMLPVSEAVEIADGVITHIDNEVDFGRLDGWYLTRLAAEKHWRHTKEWDIKSPAAKELQRGYRTDFEIGVAYNPLIERLTRRIRYIRNTWKHLQERGKGKY
jgi:hypothetical protein